jgi:hypothetical protein
MKNDDEREEFSVAIFFPDDSYTYAQRWMTLEQAVHVAKRQTSKPAALIGMIKKVIITDGGDHTVFEWQYGKGITYPPEVAQQQPEQQ